MDLGAGKIGLIYSVFCSKHPLVVTMIQVIDPGPKGLPVFLPVRSNVLIYKINVNEAYNTMQVNIMSFTHSQSLDVVNTSKHFIEGHVTYQMKRKEVQNIVYVKCFIVCVLS